MKNIIISPHTDDAIFSIGSFISQMDNVTIASPFAGIPEDAAGRKKHTILRAEHKEACKLIGAEVVNGDFFDDVYPDSYDIKDLDKWLNDVVKGFDRIFVPVGIHHPDHIKIHHLFMAKIYHKPDYYYQDLPYAVRYSFLSQNHPLIKEECKALESNDQKLKAVLEYKSQIDQKVIADVMVTERIWKV